MKHYVCVMNAREKTRRKAAVVVCDIDIYIYEYINGGGCFITTLFSTEALVPACGFVRIELASCDPWRIDIHRTRPTNSL